MKHFVTLVILLVGFSAWSNTKINTGFEQGLEGWELGTDLPHDPNNPNFPVMGFIAPSNEKAFEGIMSSKVFMDGFQDDGTVWLSRYFYLKPNQKCKVNLNFKLWSKHQSDMYIAYVTAHAGPQAPRFEMDFPRENQQWANRKAGWETYKYSLDCSTNKRGRVWVSLGVSVIWETMVTYFIDDINVEIISE